MAKVEINVIYDRKGNTMTVWFGDPKDERICEEAGGGVILCKDKRGRVIGFEKLNFLPRGARLSKKSIPINAFLAYS